MATFSSSTPGDYFVTITGTSGSLSHTTTLAVTVAVVGTADFAISASYSSLNIQAGNSGTAKITVSPNNGFTGTVTLSTSVSPSGPRATMSSSSVSGGSGTSTLTIDVASSVPAGTYIVRIQAADGNLAHSKSITVTVTGTQDVTVTASVSFLSFNSGASGTATITVVPQNGFTGAITLTLNAPSGVSCSLNSTSIQSSGTSTLTCNSSTTGDYPVTIKATGGANPHTTTVNVHVAAVSPAAPAPSTILGLDSAVFYSIIGAIIIIVVGGSVLVLRSKRSAP
jgi:uncharacterized membrane protein